MNYTTISFDTFFNLLSENDRYNLLISKTGNEVKYHVNDNVLQNIFIYRGDGTVYNETGYFKVEKVSAEVTWQTTFPGYTICIEFRTFDCMEKVRKTYIEHRSYTKTSVYDIQADVYHKLLDIRRRHVKLVCLLNRSFSRDKHIPNELEKTIDDFIIGI